MFDVRLVTHNPAIQKTQFHLSFSEKRFDTFNDFLKSVVLGRHAKNRR